SLEAPSILTVPTTITAAIPLQTRKLSRSSDPRGEWLPAEADRHTSSENFPSRNLNALESHGDGRPGVDYNSHSGLDPDLDLNSEYSAPVPLRSFAQRLWVFMSRAPLIRSSPALGSSSYGAVPIQGDSDDESYPTDRWRTRAEGALRMVHNNEPNPENLTRLIDEEMAVYLQKFTIDVLHPRRLM
ncbi:hypothetical protein N7470_006722, partial [Penicillium chermesinum]